MALSTTFTQYASEITKFGNKGKIKAISPFKVIQGTNFGTSRTPIYDFLVINTNLPSILHRFGVIAFQMSTSSSAVADKPARRAASRQTAKF